ncbi:ArsR/SmtB family transcription factor [Neorhizobium sp. NPDC001467]|uniref:ArsR/SmtB family transcription factor n=1 Tax=Neorhizobium sp. NPDC001467 TaxID=3390595 RepID=UPI003D089586
MDESEFHDRARLLDALANEKRLQILQIISSQETAVGDLALRVGLSPSALSQHLAKLWAGDFVTKRREAQSIYYSTKHPGVCAMLKTLEGLYRDDDAHPDV